MVGVMKIDMIYNEYNEPIAPQISDEKEDPGFEYKTSPDYPWSDLVKIWEKMNNSDPMYSEREKH
jgi:hypothetical protein